MPSKHYWNFPRGLAHSSEHFLSPALQLQIRLAYAACSDTARAAERWRPGRCNVAMPTRGVLEAHERRPVCQAIH